MRGTMVTVRGVTQAVALAPWCLLESQSGEACPQGTQHKGGGSCCLALLHRPRGAAGPGSCSGDRRRVLGAKAQTSLSLREVTGLTTFQQSRAHGRWAQPALLQAGV